MFLIRFLVPLTAVILVFLAVFLGGCIPQKNGNRKAKVVFGLFYLFFLTPVFGLFCSPFSYFPVFLCPITLLVYLFSRKYDFVKGPVSSKIDFFCNSAFIFGFFLVLAAELGGTPKDGIELTFPLKNRESVIFRGGVTRLFNHHIGVPEQRWALDIGLPYGVDSFKAALRGDPFQAEIFGSAVYSPCSGKIVDLANEIHDNPLGKLDKENAVGNFVRIACESPNEKVVPFTVRLAHLRRGSVALKKGQFVKAGDRIGEVGNSGNTTFPHLHFDASCMDQNGILRGMPITFNGQFYRAFAVYRQ